ncbi:hypothetical protein [Nocardiopsis sp. JB363]|nr:hypothetical protein [Nocardiopsis sp. JB363]SIO89824.1 hypothetical protein BQ8420_23560 [Nocardiopsis sp. JB363]
MMWTLRAHPDWHRRDHRHPGEEHEPEETREHTSDHGPSEQ